MEIVIQYFDGCASWTTARERVVAAASSLGIEADVRMERIGTEAEAEQAGFRGSPTILVGGRDLFPAAGNPVGLSCRIYRERDKSEGAPSIGRLMEALRQAPE